MTVRFRRILVIIILYCNLMPGIAVTRAFSQVKDTTGAGQAARMIRDLHREELYLLSHEFVYLVTADIYGQKISLPLVKDGEAHFTAWVPDSNINTILATAWKTDAGGHFITSRYAVEPWNNVSDQQVLKAVFSKELGLPEWDIHVGGMSRQILLRSDGRREEGVLLVLTDSLLGNTGWLLCRNPSQTGALTAEEKRVRAVAANGPAAADDPTMSAGPAFLYGYLPHGLADTMSTPFVRQLPVAGRGAGDKGAESGVGVGSWPEGAPVFNERGAFLGISSGANRRMPQDPPVFYPVVLSFLHKN